MEIENMANLEFEIEMKLTSIEMEMIEDDLKKLGNDKACEKWSAILKSRIDVELRRIYNGSKKKTFKN